jgi:hypothetical protein
MLALRHVRSALTRAAAPRAAVAALAARALSAAAGGAKKGTGDSSTLSHADITKAFLEMDATAAPVAGAELPVKLTGRSGELVAELYAKTSKAKTFDKATKELEVR